MKIGQLILVIAFSTISMSAWAHENHGELAQIDRAAAIEMATNKLNELIEEGKVDSSWARIKAPVAELKRQEGKQNWVVSFVDDLNKKMLTVVFTNIGTYLSVSSSDV